MMLPLPTVSDVDVNAERLKDVERDRTRPLPNIAGAAVDALKVGAAVTEMSEQERLRAEARQFQTEYVDKGWEGAQALWQKSGADPTMDPKFWRTAPNATPSAWFEALGKKADETKKKEAVSKYETLVASGTATPAELSAAEIAAGKAVSPEKGLDAIKATADRGFKAEENTKAVTSREKIASLRAAATRVAASIRSALTTAKDAGVIAAIERENGRLADIEAEISDAEANTDMSSVAVRRLTDRLGREASVINSRISSFTAKVSDPSKIPNGVRKPDAPAAADAEAESARGAIKLGAPPTAVYDRYLKNTGKRHPDDTRK